MRCTAMQLDNIVLRPSRTGMKSECWAKVISDRMNVIIEVQKA